MSLALRYPLVENERHNDTLVMQGMASSIVSERRAVWTFSALSYVGYYPLSYPSGTPFLFAEFSLLTGLSMNVIVLLEGMSLAVLFPLAIFCLSRQFISRSEYALFATVLGSLGPRFVDSSYWNGSARATFVVLAIVAVFIAFRAGYTKNNLLYLPLSLGVVGCFAFHHMAVAFILIGFAYLVSALMAYGVSRIGAFRPAGRMKRIVPAVLLVVFAIITALTALFFVSSFSPSLRYDFEHSSLFNLNPPELSIVMNLASSYTSQMGFILPIAILSIPSYLRWNKLTTEHLFLVTVLIVFIPLLPSSLYVAMFLCPFVAAIGVSWIGIGLMRKRRRLALIVIAILLSTAIVLPVWSTNRWSSIEQYSGDTMEVDNQIINDATYMSQYKERAYGISNVDITSLRLSSLSGTVFLSSGIGMILSGDVTKEMIEGNASLFDVEFPKNLYTIFEFEGYPRVEILIISLMLRGVEIAGSNGDLVQSGEHYFELHSRLLVAVDNRWPDTFVWVWGKYNATLPDQLRDAEWRSASDLNIHPLPSYKVYESEKISLYALEV